MYLLLLLFVVAVCIHVHLKIKYSYWNKKGVKGPVPVPIVGNFGRLMMQQQSLSELGESVYKQFPEEKVVGLYSGLTPVLLLRDPEIINQVMTTNFNNFINRGMRTTEGGFKDNLLISEDDTWRTTRQKMSSTFTSTKLKQIVPLIHACVDKLIERIGMTVDSEGNCDVKGLTEKYSMDLVCCCGFGLNLDFYCDEINDFSKVPKEAITPSVFYRLWTVAEILMPGIQNMLPMIDPCAKIRDFFTNLVKHVIKERENMETRRHDFMHEMIQFIHQDKLKISDKKGSAKINEEINFIASQAFVFYVTGFETSSSSLSCLLYELSSREDYQEIVYNEICTVLEKHNGKLTYDAVNEMKYLQKMFNETLRKYSVVGFIIRKASKDYILSGTDINVKAGTLLLVAPGGLHKDPKYFKDADTFNPENCSPENLKKIPQGAYIPFGLGPRNCIGLRFAKLNVMMAAAAFLQQFKLCPCTDKQKKLKFDSISFTLTPTDGIWINVTKRN